LKIISLNAIDSRTISEKLRYVQILTLMFTMRYTCRSVTRMVSHSTWRI